MHPLYAKADALTHEIIGAAIEVHRDKGPGLIESIYERCFMHELSLRKHEAVVKSSFELPTRISFLKNRFASTYWSKNVFSLKPNPSSEYSRFTRLNS